MDDEGRARSRAPDRARPVRSTRPESVALGLIPAPEIPEKIAGDLASELPDLLSRHVDGRVSWNVSVVVDPLTGSDRDAPEILDVCQQRLRKEGWDLAVCLTDLPVYRSGHLIASPVRGCGPAASTHAGCGSPTRQGTVLEEPGSRTRRFSPG